MANLQEKVAELAALEKELAHAEYCMKDYQISITHLVLHGDENLDRLWDLRGKVHRKREELKEVTK